MTKRTPLYKPKAGELVEIEWTDSFYDSTTDGPPEDYSDRVARIVSVGFFVKQGREGLVIAACRSPKDGTMRHYVTIPRVNVRAIHPCERRASEA